MLDFVSGGERRLRLFVRSGVYRDASGKVIGAWRVEPHHEAGVLTIGFKADSNGTDSCYLASNAWIPSLLPRRLRPLAIAIVAHFAARNAENQTSFGGKFYARHADQALQALLPKSEGDSYLFYLAKRILEDCGIPTSFDGPIAGGPMIAACARLLAAPSRELEMVLDPDAIAFMRPTSLFLNVGFRDQAARCWDGLDRNCTPGAPLLSAVQAYPHLASELFDNWMTDRDSARTLDPRAMAIASLRRPAVPTRRGSTDALHMSRAQATRIVNATPEILSDDAWKHFERQNPPFRPASGSFSLPAHVDRELVSIALPLLTTLPIDWIPRGPAEWASFLSLARALNTAVSTLMPRGGIPSKFIDAKANWSAYSLRIEKAADCPASALVMAVDDAFDPGRRLSHEAILPALVLRLISHPTPEVSRRVVHLLSVMSPGFIPFQLLSAVNLLMHGDRTLPGILEASREWHRRLPVHDAAFAAAVPSIGPARAWQPGLPDRKFGNIDIKVLTSKRELSYEGGNVEDENGVPGLSHCVGGYWRDCAAGRSRILSIRKLLPDGDYQRLSTAEVAFSADDSLLVQQHRGKNNGPAPDEAQEALDTYILSVEGEHQAASWPRCEDTPLSKSSIAAISRASKAVRSVCTSVLIHASYDFTIPGAWQSVWRLWGHHLPRPVRDWDWRQVADYVLDHYAEEG